MSLRNDLEDVANRMRISSIQMVDAAKSGHTTSSCSAGKKIRILENQENLDLKNPKNRFEKET